jgi:CBS-domain-containing membrane protein
MGGGMKTTARDIMTTRFHTLTPEMPVDAAVRLLGQAGKNEGRRIFGLMVVDEAGRLVGMLSMYDILLFMRPKHTHIWGMMDDIDLEGIVNRACEKTRSIQVGDIMSTEVVTIPPQTHLMMILDLMIKKHIRRLPVVEEGKILGIVYISDLFFNILERFAVEEGD